MKIIHKPEIDYLSIDFRDEVEAKSLYQDGVIVRLDKKGNIIGIDIVDFQTVFAKSTPEDLALQEVCKLLGVSESTLRRKIKEGLIPFSKPNGKDFRFKKSDILALLKKAG